MIIVFLFSLIFMAAGLALIRKASKDPKDLDPKAPKEIGEYLREDTEKIMNFFSTQFGWGSFLYILGLSILASWDVEKFSKENFSFLNDFYEVIYSLCPSLFDGLLYFSFNTFWSILWAGIGLTFVFEDLRKRWDNASKDSQSEKQQPSSQKTKKEITTQPPT